MNILFLLRSIGIGGVEVVSVTLANMLVERGHCVSLFAREPRKKNLSDRLSPNVHVYVGYGDNDCKENVEALREVYMKEKIDMVINQWGLPYTPIRLALKASGNHHVKIVSFYHNDPSVNGKLNAVNIKIKKSSSTIKKSFYYLQKSIYHIITSFSMRYTYNHSDKYLVLSDSYLPNLQHFIRVPFENKQGVLQNPITIDSKGFVYSKELKKKEIIFCGRMDDIQKCPRRVLDVWEILQKKFPDWSLRFVGDGPDRLSVEEEARQRGLSNVFFEGFQNPIEYYKRASILVMTSDFEGFPLVLAECMSFGVVPCVYNSFAALKDILHDGENGFVVEKEKDGFSARKMSEQMNIALSNQEKLSSMALAAIETSRRYSIDNIYKSWEALIKEMFN